MEDTINEWIWIGIDVVASGIMVPFFFFIVMSWIFNYFQTVIISMM